MIKKFNEYNTIEDGLEFSESDVASLTVQVEEALIDMIDDGFNIGAYSIGETSNKIISIIIHKSTLFEYPFESDVQQQHFIDLLHLLNDEYSIDNIKISSIRGWEFITLADILDGRIPNNYYIECDYLVIQIRKNILRHMRTTEKRYIKTFESNEETLIDQAYIEECFIDMPCKAYLLTLDICVVDININPLSGYRSVYDFIDKYKSTLDMLNDIEANLRKVKMKYKNIRHKIAFFTDDKLRVALFLDNDGNVSFDIKE